MNENELAEKFSRQLDAALSGGGKPAGFSPDPGAMAAAAKLARADFSGDSAIRETLRAGLLARDGEAAGRGLYALLSRRSGWLPVAAAAACLLLVMLPVMRQEHKPAPAVAPAVRADPALPVSSAAAPGARKEAPAIAAAKAAPAPAPIASALPARPAESGFFHSIPMASVSGARIREFPIESRKGGPLFGRVKVKKVALPRGSGMVWETEHAVFTIERREISREELFQRKAI